MLMVGVGLLLMRGLTRVLALDRAAGRLHHRRRRGRADQPGARVDVAIGVVPPQRSGMASGINNTFRQVGIATGIAALGAIFESTLIRPSSRRSSPARRRRVMPRRSRHAVAAGGAQKVIAGVPAGAASRRRRPRSTARSPSAMNDILLVGGIVALVGAALAFALVRSSDFVTYGAPEPAAHAGWMIQPLFEHRHDARRVTRRACSSSRATASRS